MEDFLIDEKPRETPTADAEQSEAPTMNFEIGGSTYIVGIHFNQNTKETLSDKLNRLIRRDVLGEAYGGI